MLSRVTVNTVDSFHLPPFKILVLVFLQCFKSCYQSFFTHRKHGYSRCVYKHCFFKNLECILRGSGFLLYYCSLPIDTSSATLVLSVMLSSLLVSRAILCACSVSESRIGLLAQELSWHTSQRLPGGSCLEIVTSWVQGELLPSHGSVCTYVCL